MAKAEFDTSEGWCCDGRTYKEHAQTDGKCCQLQGKQSDDFPLRVRKQRVAADLLMRPT